MSSIQVLALFFIGLLAYWGVVFFLTLLGLPLIGAFLLVYLAGVFLMAGMQRRARECAELQQTELHSAGRPIQRLYTPGGGSLKYSSSTISLAGGAARESAT